MGCYLDGNGNYYEGDRQGLDQEVPQRPSSLHDFSGGLWTINPARFNADIWNQVRALEAREMLPRSARDLVKKSCVQDAATIGMTLDQVYAIAVAQGDAAPEAAKGWKKFKDFDDSITALKRQLL